ncbi:MAG TPA: winged helix-turn-helix transcriptional regulator [Sphingomicrobium sp.]|nr:winged helix-turn-helix transcriptional regulator [Sphingomicrobium sp.]
MNDFSVTESSRSRDRILELMLRSDSPLSVQALAAAVGISRNAAHQQVMALEREGLIERASAIRTKGRPSQGFQLSPAGKATFPRQYSLLAKQLLVELSQILGPAELHLAMQRIGKSLAASLSDKVGVNADQELIAGLMRELGYESRVVEGDGGLEIEAHNCVFHDLAKADPSICEVDLALLESLSGKAVDHRRCMARGEGSCRFSFSPKQTGA